MTAAKPLLLYVGHGYHRQTGSTTFFLELLAERYRVEILWDDSWQDPSKKIDARAINAFAPDVVLFFQALPKRAEISRIHCRHIVFIPMYDAFVHGAQRMRRRLRAQGVRVINFCQPTHAFFSGLGYRSLRVQFWPAPKVAELQECAGVRILFWIRRNEIGWPLLKQLLGSFRPAGIVLRYALDPGQTIVMPTEEERKEFNVAVVDGWLDKDQYVQMLASCNVFMAPRLYEGIGLSFLEAMTQGLAIIAPNCPTMNEYIRHQETGYLYNPVKPVAVDFTRLQEIREGALAAVVNGHRTWNDQKAEIHSFIAAPSAPMTLGGYIVAWCRSLPIIGRLI